MIAVIGAGVVGLACARALAIAGLDVVVLERHRLPGMETSTHNSGVIHAGLYYPQDSLKARLCLDGREQLFAYCAAQGVPHVRCGKLIIAAEIAEEPALDGLMANATASGAVLRDASPAFVRAREPHVAFTRALWSPDTGWIDAAAYVHALTADLRRRDVPVLVGTAPIACEPAGDHLVLVTERERIEIDLVVNAAGLYADDVSTLCGGERFQIYPCRGEYAELAPRARGRINGLVYPVPDPSGHGLGAHFVRTLSGAVTIGPTIEYRARKDDYESERLPLEAFVAPTARMLPGVTIDDLRLGGSGIRAKLHPPTERFADFMIRFDTHQPRLFHAAGIDSPGLTSSLAIAEMVADGVREFR